MRRTALMSVLAGVVGALVAVPIAVYASHSFNDVPDSNTFHEDIAWLKDSGVTLGCNPPANTEFCPKDNVTREQMAAFLHRFASAGVGFDSTRLYANWVKWQLYEAEQLQVSCDEGDVLLSGATRVYTGNLFGEIFHIDDGPIPAGEVWARGPTGDDPNAPITFRVDGPFTGWRAEVWPEGVPPDADWAVVAYCYDVG